MRPRRAAAPAIAVWLTRTISAGLSSTVTRQPRSQLSATTSHQPSPCACTSMRPTAAGMISAWRTSTARGGRSERRGTIAQICGLDQSLLVGVDARARLRADRYGSIWAAVTGRRRGTTQALAEIAGARSKR